MKFAIGDKVIQKDLVAAHSSYPVLQVVGILDGVLLTMNWGDGFGGELTHYDFLEDVEPGSRNWRNAISRYQESELFTPEEVVVELHRLEDIKSKLEQDFEGVRLQVQEKMNQAAAIVKEAGALVLPTGKELYDLTDECKELYVALDEGGWSHSTMQCRFGR